MRIPPHSPRARTTRTAARIAVAGLLVLASACADGVGPGPAPESEPGLEPKPKPEPEEQLLFISTRGDDRPVEWSDRLKEIYRMNADGTGMENLTRHPARTYRSLSLSPDGTRIAFNSDRSGCHDIWVMNTDGTHPTRLTNQLPSSSDRCNFIPRWSPDGSRIAFQSSRERTWAVYVMNADGGDPHNVSTPVELNGGSAWPAGWSPDGWVVFNSVQPGRGTASILTYIVKADGTSLTPLLEPGDDSPAWSPDGSRIAFISDREGSYSLYVMNANGTNVRKLSNLPGEDLFAPSWGYWENEYSPWSPDGTRIAFTNRVGQATALYVVDADGSGPRRLTAPELDAEFNGWSPLGTRIAFTSAAAGTKDVYVINPDGTGMVNVTDSPDHESDALWLPRR